MHGVHSLTPPGGLQSYHESSPLVPVFLLMPRELPSEHTVSLELAWKEWFLQGSWKTALVISVAEHT